MATKSPPSGNAKKPGKSVKEKRAAKQEKQASQAKVRQSWDK
jgi:hypothetical protein